MPSWVAMCFWNASRSRFTSASRPDCSSCRNRRSQESCFSSRAHIRLASASEMVMGIQLLSEAQVRDDCICNLLVADVVSALANLCLQGGYPLLANIRRPVQLGLQEADPARIAADFRLVSRSCVCRARRRNIWLRDGGLAYEIVNGVCIEIYFHFADPGARLVQKYIGAESTCSLTGIGKT